MKHFVEDRCPFCEKEYLDMGLETVGDVLNHDKVCKENSKNENKK